MMAVLHPMYCEKGSGVSTAVSQGKSEYRHAATETPLPGHVLRVKVGPSGSN